MLPNDELANNLTVSIESNEFSSQFLQDLNSGKLNLVSQNVISLSTVFNIQGLSKKSQNSSDNEQKAFLREYLIKKVVDLSAFDISRIKIIASSLAASTGNTKQITRNSAVKGVLSFN